MRCLLLPLAFVAIATMAFSAQADTKAQCFDGYEQSQQLRKQGRLRAARQQLIACASSQCPELTRPDCVVWLREVDQALPSIVVRATDSGGHDLSNVRVLFDTEQIATRLDGNAIPVDPGDHSLVFEYLDQVVEQKVLIAAGEKNRLVLATFPARKLPSYTAADRQVSPPRAEPTGVPTGAYILGGLGLLSLGVAAYFEWHGLKDRSHLFDTCAPSCANADVDHAYQQLLIGDVAAGIGLASLGAAIGWAVLSRPSAPNHAPSLSLRPTFGGGMGSFQARF